MSILCVVNIVNAWFAKVNSRQRKQQQRQTCWNIKHKCRQLSKLYASAVGVKRVLWREIQFWVCTSRIQYVYLFEGFWLSSMKLQTLLLGNIRANWSSLIIVDPAESFFIHFSKRICGSAWLRQSNKASIAVVIWRGGGKGRDAQLHKQVG